MKSIIIGLIRRPVKTAAQQLMVFFSSIGPNNQAFKNNNNLQFVSPNWEISNKYIIVIIIILLFGSLHLNK